MQLLGITGAIGHGKSTLAQDLNKAPDSIHLETYYIVAEVADALHEKLDKVPLAGDYEAVNKWLENLPEILKAITNVDVPHGQIAISHEAIAEDPLAYQKLFQHLDNLVANGDLRNHKITDDNKASYRPILQWLGGYLVAKVSPTIWWDEMIRRALTAENKGTKLAILGGVRYPTDAEVVHNAGGKIIQIMRPGVGETDIMDPTERERQKIKPDTTIINNGTLADLDNCAQHMLEDLQANQLKPEYLASPSS